VPRRRRVLVGKTIAANVSGAGSGVDAAFSWSHSSLVFTAGALGSSLLNMRTMAARDRRMSTTIPTMPGTPPMLVAPCRYFVVSFSRDWYLD
jgi:hypothetical protein